MARTADHSPQNIGKFIDEVFWRGYFKGWLQHRPAVWSSYRSDLNTLIAQLESDQSMLERYNSAVDGSTGIDCFDAWSKELVETGYLHNHARMWFASIWVFTLKLPWVLGADFFLRHLVDGDPASNTLSWRWVSGLHTKGKTYLARVSNIVNFTDQRFNPQGQLATEALPLVEETSFEEKAVTFDDVRLPEEPYGLLISEDDCNPESLAEQLRPVGVIGGLAIRRRSVLPVGAVAHRFSTGAVQDAVRRSGDAFDVPSDFFEADEWAETLAEWATKTRINTIVTAAPPVGPVADVLLRARQVLTRYGINVFELNRQYDRETWPYAGRGYFKLKNQIPAILERLEAGDWKSGAAKPGRNVQKEGLASSG